MNWLKRAFGTERAPSFTAELAPDEPFYAIGDIHGNYDALEALLERLDKREPKPAICVGDYVDRGEESGRVLRRLHQLNSYYPQHFICLRGNHEEMMLRFLEAPEENGERWLRFGGLQTLLSFRVSRSSNESMTSVRDRLRDAMGDDLIAWLADLPLTWQSGNVVVCHAGMDPAAAIDTQTGQTLVWGHPDFGKIPRKDGIWVVHGHNIVEAAIAQDGVISIDTGAYATNVLTAAEIAVGEVVFVHSQG